MAKAEKTLKHQGLIQKITPTNITVLIQGQVSCSGCQAQTYCGASGVNEKFVVVHHSNHNFRVGEEVTVVLMQSVGYWALFLGYLLPFTLVVGSLILFFALGLGEGLAGCLSVFLLFPYYSTLYLFKASISKRFHFDLQKI